MPIAFRQNAFPDFVHVFIQNRKRIEVIHILGDERSVGGVAVHLGGPVELFVAGTVEKFLKL